MNDEMFCFVVPPTVEGEPARFETVGSGGVGMSSGTAAFLTYMVAHSTGWLRFGVAFASLSIEQGCQGNREIGITGEERPSTRARMRAYHVVFSHLT